ncbi:MAG: hypothetical protein NUV74_13215 [Candidatus Brocadiaceae bacterium]|nr:hypothetical protein [Candidatus Brocadiaceae bacterium]
MVKWLKDNLPFNRITIFFLAIQHRVTLFGCGYAALGNVAAIHELPLHIVAHGWFNLAD